MSGSGNIPSQRELNWKFVDELTSEDEILEQARQQALEYGIEPVSPAVGSHLSVVTSLLHATSIIEVGTGTGVSGLYLLRGAPEATLTTIDVEPTFQHAAREHFRLAGIPATRVRTIVGRAENLLSRMNEDAYQAMFIDADPTQVIAYVEHGLRLVQDGGCVLVAHALWHGRVADPARREPAEVAIRDLLAELAKSTAITYAVSPAGDGLLLIVKRPRN